ncbi:MAG: hypothetical protein ACYDGR_10370 [Candidatus Dormibacteria bacterium]
MKRSVPTAGLLMVLIGALGLVVYFDMQSALPLGDEWMFRYPLQSIAAGRGFHLWPGALPLALPQLLLDLPLAHADPRAWRLMEVPALALIALLVRRLSLRLGSTPGWSAAVAVCVCCNPVTLSVATGFTSDIVYLCLLLGAASAAAEWLLEGRWRKTCIALAVLATLQRQHGLVIAPVVVMALLTMSPRRLNATDRAHMGVLLTATMAALLGPLVSGLRSSSMNALATGSGAIHPSVGPAVGAIVESGPMLGLYFFPLALALLMGSRQPAQRSRWDLIPTGFGVVGLVASAMFALVFGTMILPGNVFGNWGLGPLYLGGSKAGLLPLPIFFLIEALVVGTFAIALVHRRAAWSPVNLGPMGALLTILALAHLPFMAFTSPLDRYFLPVVALCAPVLARAAGAPRTRAARRLAGTWCGVFACAWIAYFAIGQQDYLSWQVARDQAARRAYESTSPGQVDAGYEAVAKYVAVPEYAATGRLEFSPIDLHPPAPLVRLEFRHAGAGGDGIDYRSVAPGRIVLVPVPPPPH